MSKKLKQSTSKNKQTNNCVILEALFIAVLIIIFGFLILICDEIFD